MECEGPSRITVSTLAPVAEVTLPDFYSPFLLSRPSKIQMLDGTLTRSCNVSLHTAAAGGGQKDYWCMRCEPSGGMTFLAFADRIPGFSFLPDVSLLVVYGTFILAVGNFMRSALILSQSPHNIPIQEIGDTSCIDTLIEYIYQARRLGGCPAARHGEGFVPAPDRLTPAAAVAVRENKGTSLT